VILSFITSVPISIVAIIRPVVITDPCFMIGVTTIMIAILMGIWIVSVMIPILMGIRIMRITVAVIMMTPMVSIGVGIWCEPKKQRKKKEEELKHLAIIDPLTNIYNYRHFLKSLNHEINRLKRYSGSLCLLMIDVDDFKSYNDTYGHLEGDMLLRQVSKALSKTLRKVDIVCRYAGDEFVVILPESQAFEAEIVAEKIRKKVEALSLKRKVTLSIGIGEYINNMNLHELIRNADTALYRAKKKVRIL